MLTYASLAQHADQFLAMTAYTVEEFQALLPAFRAEFVAYTAKFTLAGRPRGKRAYSAYKNSPLPTIEDKLLFILVYLKQNSLQTAHGVLFGMAQPDANQWIHLLHPLLNQALAALGAHPARTATTFTPETEATLIFWQDGTERPIPRPTDATARRLYYSGKKKHHTLKNIVVINPDSRVIFLSQTCEGTKHDKRAADEAGYTLPANSVLLQDIGFQGFTLAEVLILQPQKKPRGHDLPPETRLDNQAIAALRIQIEHAIGGVKRYRIVKDEIRNWKAGFRDKVMETCCALHNFRLTFRPWSHEPLAC
ncbi:MAG: transposase [Chloroflexi bacterium]|nr:transposase [Chloroflexota bacterium]